MVLHLALSNHFTHIATRSIPIVFNLLYLSDNSNLVPTPSVQETIIGFFIFKSLISNKELNEPILLFAFLTFFSLIY